MGYLQALNLLIKTYKATKGYLPKGIDMLKLKMKARQKVIDSKKVIKFPQGGKDKINPFEPRPTKPEGIIPVTVKGKTTKMTPEGIIKMLTGKGKGKVAETEAQMLARMKKQNKESVARLKEKKEKTLGEKLKDYKGDPDDMKDGGKVKKKRKHNDNVDDEDIGEGKSKERFLRVMPQASDIPRSDGIMELATGGMTNISDTYDNNPTLQSQYPNKQDYLDLFAQQTTTTPQYATTYQSTGSIAPINPIKPIIPIPQDGGDGGGDPPGPKGNPNFDYETEAYGLANLTPEQKGITQEEQEMLDKEKSGIMNLLSLSPTFKTLSFVKKGIEKTSKTIKDYFKQKAEEKAAKEEALSSLRASMARDAARNAQQDWSGSSDSYSGGMDTSTGNYDDPYDSGQTE